MKKIPLSCLGNILNTEMGSECACVCSIGNAFIGGQLRCDETDGIRKEKYRFNPLSPETRNPKPETLNPKP